MRSLKVLLKDSIHRGIETRANNFHPVCLLARRRRTTIIFVLDVKYNDLFSTSKVLLHQRHNYSSIFPQKYKKLQCICYVTWTTHSCSPEGCAPRSHRHQISTSQSCVISPWWLPKYKNTVNIVLDELNSNKRHHFKNRHNGVAINYMLPADRFRYGS